MSTSPNEDADIISRLGGAMDEKSTAVNLLN